MFNIIVQVRVRVAPQSGVGYGGILLLSLIVFVIYIVIKLYLKKFHKHPTYRELSNDVKPVKNNLYRMNKTNKMLREEHSIKNENLYASTKSATTSPNEGGNRLSKLLIIWGGCVSIGLHIILWTVGYISIARYDDSISSFFNDQYCKVSKNGNQGVVERIYILGVELYKEVIPCRYQNCTGSSMLSQQCPYGYSPNDKVILVRDFNGKVAVASTCGVFYTDFIYDAVGFSYNDGSFWATFNRNSDGYLQQIDGFFVAPALENGKYKLIDNKGTQLTSAIYDEIEPPHDGLKLRARIGREWLTLDVKGLYAVKLNGGFEMCIHREELNNDF